jgi:Tol biopolymer transport system component
MKLDPGTRLGPYEIVSPIGAGGMGEVYRGRDTRLERSVAIKVLPGQFSANANLKLRFEREARAISQLNHPHICTLHDVGSDGGVQYLVMELIDGETLADRIARGPLPLAAVLEYGAQIAEALEAAHRAGIVHRDLKPGNIMLTKSGAKLLDFGLARASDSGGAVDPQAPTTAQSREHKPLTAEGTIVGTFQYMAPEQLEGEEADRRTDIFALGCVLYEMLTGRRAFEGKTRTSLIAAIVGSEPRPMRELQPLTPITLEHVIERCLEKNRDDRWQTARDVSRELAWIAETPAVPTAKPRRVSMTAVALLVLAATILAATAVAMWWRRPASVARAASLRFAIPPPEGRRYLDAQISPDGTMLAASLYGSGGGGAPSIWLRPMDALEARQVPGTERAYSVFWSPDSKWLGFFADGKVKKLNVASGEIDTLCQTLGLDARGGTWGEDGTILFALTNGPIQRVSANGGKAEPATSLDATLQEKSHRYPSFLPGGREFVYLGRGSDAAQQGVYLASLDSPARTRVMNARSAVVAAPPDLLLFVSNNVLYAQRLDATARRVIGDPVKIAERVQHAAGTGHAFFSVSRDGQLVFFPAHDEAPAPAWIDASGKEQQTIDFAARSFVLSPDATRIACEIADPSNGTNDIWIYDLVRRTPHRLTTDPNWEQSPVWTPDGRSVVYRGARSDGVHLIRASATGDAAEERLYVEPYAAIAAPLAVTPDGTLLVYQRYGETTKADLWAMPLVPRGKPYPLLSTSFNEGRNVRFHPSGRWVAFLSDEIGTGEVYVQRFEQGKLTGMKVPVSRGGGAVPRWSHDGKQLFFVAGGKLMAMTWDAATGTAGDPRPLFEVGYAQGLEPAPDGTRFLISRLSPAAFGPLTVVLNWPAALERRSGD